MNEEEMNARAEMALEVIKMMGKAGYKSATVFLKANDVTNLLGEITNNTVISDENAEKAYGLFCEIEKLLKEFKKELEE